jgi:hypothetical protein
MFRADADSRQNALKRTSLNTRQKKEYFQEATAKIEEGMYP